MKACFFLLFLLFLACTQQATSEDKSQEPLPTEAVNPVVEQKSVDEERPETTTSSQKEISTLESGVYVTNEGDKYHTADCRYSKTAHFIKLSQAKADGKTACGICKPNSKTGEKQLRCSANTAEGKRCQRMTTDASGKCYQHREG